MRILSLFDWMSCWYEALKKAWISIDAYYASEIDKYAIQIATKNHPDIIDGKRRRRIADGAGTTVQEENKFIVTNTKTLVQTGQNIILIEILLSL